MIQTLYITEIFTVETSQNNILHTLLMTQHSSSLEKRVSLLQQFHKHAGLKLNKEKPEAMHFSNSNLNLNQYKISVQKGKL